MLKLTVGACRKMGLADYGSAGSSLTMEVELPAALLDDAAALKARVRGLQDLAQLLVVEDLEQRGRGGKETHPPMTPMNTDEGKKISPSPSSPSASSADRPASPPAPAPTHVNVKPFDGPPLTGKSLFKWAKDQEAEYEVGVYQYLNQWAKLQGFPGKMVEFSPEQVKMAYDEARRKLAAASGRGAPA